MNALRVFLKTPRLGEVKTRLAAALGEHAALRIYRAMAEAAIAATAPRASDRYEQVLCFAPPDGREEITAWFPDRKLAEQRGADLGERMADALQAAFGDGAPRVAVIGTDVPGLGRSHVLEAYERLDSADLVLGPTLDGGYYLIGLKQPQPRLFAAMPWSTPEVLPRTLARAVQLGLRVHQLEELRDMDTIDDLRACADRLGPLFDPDQRW